MSIQFVSTSILESEDGVDFGKETASKASGDVDRQKEQRKNQDGSLYERLAAREDEKQQEFDKNGELLRAPTSGLDQDDVDFFNDVNMKEKSAYRDRVQEDNARVATFRKKRRDAEQEQSEARFTQETTKSVLSKRKASATSSQATMESEKMVVAVKKVKKSESSTGKSSTASEPPATSESVVALLSGYDSESD